MAIEDRATGVWLTQNPGDVIPADETLHVVSSLVKRSCAWTRDEELEIRWEINEILEDHRNAPDLDGHLMQWLSNRVEQLRKDLITELNELIDECN